MLVGIFVVMVLIGGVCNVGLFVVCILGIVDDVFVDWVEVYVCDFEV